MHQPRTKEEKKKMENQRKRNTNCGKARQEGFVTQKVTINDQAARIASLDRTKSHLESTVSHLREENSLQLAYHLIKARSSHKKTDEMQINYDRLQKKYDDLKQQ